MAQRLWFRIPRPRADLEAAEFLLTGERFTVDLGGARIAAWRWGTGPIVLLMHGWGGYAGQMRAFVPPLVRAGRQVIAFDSLSHGASEHGSLGPHSTTLFEFSDALRAIARDVPAVDGVIAHSGGCAATSWALSHADLRPRRVVFIAPFGSPARYMSMFQSLLGFSDAAMRRFRSDSEQRFGFRWDDFEPVAMVSRQSSPPPLLVFHDRDDRETSWQDGADIAAAWPNATLVTTAGLGHNRILRDQSVVESAAKFLVS